MRIASHFINSATRPNPWAKMGATEVEVAGESRMNLPGGGQARFFHGREGYQDTFLSTPLPLPRISPEQAEDVAVRWDHPGNPVLKYSNYSVVLNKTRKMPYFTAVNLHGGERKSSQRTSSWVYDARIAPEEQLGESAYHKSGFHRGHITRRLDPAWGANVDTSVRDTFVYTNAIPQQAKFNTGSWSTLERSIDRWAKASNRKVSVFTGPVFRPDDPPFDNNGKLEKPIQIPQSFWKVVSWQDSDGQLRSESFVMGVDDKVVFGDSEDPLEPYRVPVSKIEKLTQLSFPGVGPSTEPEIAVKDR